MYRNNQIKQDNRFKQGNKMMELLIIIVIIGLIAGGKTIVEVLRNGCFGAVALILLAIVLIIGAFQ